MAEIRTTSSTGGQKGMKPERHDLLPREGIEAIARVFGFGATKYADHNWRKGYEWSKSYAALQRHLYAFWAGETYDEESGLPHLAHAGFHILVLLTWLENDGEGSQFDDRFTPTPKGCQGDHLHSVDCPGVTLDQIRDTLQRVYEQNRAEARLTVFIVDPSGVVEEGRPSI